MPKEPISTQEALDRANGRLLAFSAPAARTGPLSDYSAQSIKYALEEAKALVYELEAALSK